MRETTEKFKVLEDAESKFQLTQQFDLIACRYKDKVKEEGYIGERKMSQSPSAIQQRTQMSLKKLPPSIQRSETQFYNMITNTITDPTAIQEINDKNEQKRQAKFARRAILDRIQKSADIKTTPVLIYKFLSIIYRVLPCPIKDTKSL